MKIYSKLISLIMCLGSSCLVSETFKVEMFKAEQRSKPWSYTVETINKDGKSSYSQRKTIEKNKKAALTLDDDNTYKITVSKNKTGGSSDVISITLDQSKMAELNKGANGILLTSRGFLIQPVSEIKLNLNKLSVTNGSGDATITLQSLEKDLPMDTQTLRPQQHAFLAIPLEDYFNIAVYQGDSAKGNKLKESYTLSQGQIKKYIDAGAVVTSQGKLEKR